MAAKYDFSQMKAFFQRMEQAAKGGFREELALFLEGQGFELLRIVQDEIIRRKVVDTTLLLNSFHKGKEGNVWELSSNGLTLEVGTNVEYATFVNNGHKQQPGRFIPGVWKGSKFIYTPGAKTGMVLKENYVSGKHYWDGALFIYERIFPKEAENMLNKWLDSYFSM